MGAEVSPIPNPPTGCRVPAPPLLVSARLPYFGRAWHAIMLPHSQNGCVETRIFSPMTGKCLPLVNRIFSEARKRRFRPPPLSNKRSRRRPLPCTDAHQNLAACASTSWQATAEAAWPSVLRLGVGAYHCYIMASHRRERGGQPPAKRSKGDITLTRHSPEAPATAPGTNGKEAAHRDARRQSAQAGSS